eukprot:3331227-Amphidinium_carterae.2
MAIFLRPTGNKSHKTPKQEPHSAKAPAFVASEPEGEVLVQLVAERKMMRLRVARSELSKVWPWSRPACLLFDAYRQVYSDPLYSMNPTWAPGASNESSAQDPAEISQKEKPWQWRKRVDG